MQSSLSQINTGLLLLRRRGTFSSIFQLNRYFVLLYHIRHPDAKKCTEMRHSLKQHPDSPEQSHGSQAHNHPGKQDAEHDGN